MFEKFNPFGDIGKKIKLLAKFLFVAAPVITLLVIISGGSVWPCVIAGVSVFLSSWLIYGFGQLVQDIHDIRLGDKRLNNHDDELPRL